MFQAFQDTMRNLIGFLNAAGVVVHMIWIQIPETMDLSSKLRKTCTGLRTSDVGQPFTIY